MTTITLSNAFDMNALTAQGYDPRDGHVTSSSSTSVAVGYSGHYAATFGGTDLGGFDPDGMPTTGTFTDLALSRSGVAIAAVNGFSIGVSDWLSRADTSDTAAFQTALLAGNDTINDSKKNDFVFGLGGNDTFNMTHGGIDSVDGGKGNDIINFGATLTADDTVNGGKGADTLLIGGKYAAGTVIVASEVTGIEKVLLTAGFDYSFQLNAADGTLLAFDGSKLGNGDILTAAVAAASKAAFTITGGAANDSITGGNGADNLIGGAGDDVLNGSKGSNVLSGGAGNDTINLLLGAADTVSGGAGNDVFNFGSHLDAKDKIDGGTGDDIVKISGDYTAGILLSGNLTGVETLQLTKGNGYYILAGGVVARGATLTIDGSKLAASDYVFFDGSYEPKGSFNLLGSAGRDYLFSGAGADHIQSGTSFDRIAGGAGADVFVYGAATDSDQIDDFDPRVDKIDVVQKVTGIDHTVIGGNVFSFGRDSFYSDLSATVTASWLGAHHAMLLQTNPSPIGGIVYTYLVIDQDGIAGFSAGHDLAFLLKTTDHLDALSVKDFI